MTDRRTELRWLRRATAVAAVARKNNAMKPLCGRNKQAETKPTAAAINDSLVGEVKEVAGCLGVVYSKVESVVHA